MDIRTYENEFRNILEGHNHLHPYDNEVYLNYVKLNERRLKRWYKTGKLLPELEELIKGIDHSQHWLLITEPWCGDAAHVQPFIAKMAKLNPLITLTLQNRDAPGSEINKYLTNGSKSIPKLVVRDDQSEDLFTWGPRPKGAQAIHLKHVKDDTIPKEEKKIELQNWYNQDKGESFQREFLVLMETLLAHSN